MVDQDDKDSSSVSSGETMEAEEASLDQEHKVGYTPVIEGSKDKDDRNVEDPKITFDKLSPGDFVRISPSRAANKKKFLPYFRRLGRIVKVEDDSSSETGNHLYTVEWLDHRERLSGIRRDHLVQSDAENIPSVRQSRKRKKPESYEEDAKRLDEKKEQHRLLAAAARGAKRQGKEKKMMPSNIRRAILPKRSQVKSTGSASQKKLPRRGSLPKTTSKSGRQEKKSDDSLKKRPKEKASAKQKVTKSQDSGKPIKQSKPNKPATSTTLDLYERHRREFERFLERLENKIDKHHRFRRPVPDEYDETKGDANDGKPKASTKVLSKNTTVQGDEDDLTDEESSVGSEDDGLSHKAKIVKSDETRTTKSPLISHPHPPYNWKMVRRRMELGRYVLDREKVEEDARFADLEGYYQTLGENRPERIFTGPNASEARKAKTSNARVLNRFGVHWELFRDDVIAMCDSGIAHETEDADQPSSITSAAKKIKEIMLQKYDATGKRQFQELNEADHTHKYFNAIEGSQNNEAAMQKYRDGPFPERIYERLSADKVCDGLSKVDEDIAKCERQTSLKDSFVGLAYRYDDTGQSEAWMKSLVDETAANGRSKDKVRQAALALSADDGVTRAQVVATMTSLLISVQDRVLTEQKVLHHPEIRSVNWGFEHGGEGIKQALANEDRQEDSVEDQTPDIVEQPVWGMDCYTRRNIMLCLQTEFDKDTALLFIERWLLPAINACNAEYAQDIRNAARLLEGRPLVSCSTSTTKNIHAARKNDEDQQLTILGAALQRKIATSAPPWLKAAASEIRKARTALGPNFFRIHPKGHGSVLLSRRVKANRLVTFYRGELYPSWRWGEKMDAIAMTQERKSLKPELPDFYNMALERPQADPRGYGLLFVDASRKAGYGSSLSHSCDPTCEVRVAAKDGELCLAMTTLRELEMGEELTFDYHAVTESLNEYKSAVCLCGYGKCRGSFLHFATADCYQQVLNRNAPIATRFSNLVKGSTKKIMSEDDERVLRNHGFNTAAFGAISINRREEASLHGKSSLLDSMEMVPVWLKTYVADTLRYIEYERRALPISLICDHLSSVKGQTDAAEEPQEHSEKEPGREPDFFFFARVERDSLLATLKKTGEDQSLKGLALQNALKREASIQWKTMSNERKEYYKKRSNDEFQKKKKAWKAKRAESQSPSSKGEEKAGGGSATKRHKQQKSRSKGSPDISDVLFSSEMSFEDADAEGVSAMEQRIQQLTQSLNRVGRVLDRHREGVLQSGQTSIDAADVQTLRRIVHAPVVVLPDEKVIGWIWKAEHGVVRDLLSHARDSRCVRPSLAERLRHVVEDKYSFLEDFEVPTVADVEETHESSPKGIEGRHQLRKALLEMRAIVLDELKELTRDFRRVRAQAKTKAAMAKKLAAKSLAEALSPEVSNGAKTVDTPGIRRNRKEKADAATSNGFDALQSTIKVEEEDDNPGVIPISNLLLEPTESRLQECAVKKTDIERGICGDRFDKKEVKREDKEDGIDKHARHEEADNRVELRVPKEEELDESVEKRESKQEDANNRREEGGRILHLAKDRIRIEESEPQCAEERVEKSIPKQEKAENQRNPDIGTSSKDENSPHTKYYEERWCLQAASDVLLMYANTQNFFVMRDYRPLESTPVEVYARELGNDVPVTVIDESVVETCNIAGKMDTSHGDTNPVSKTSPSKDAKRICSPDDIVAEVTVRYQGDYVLSQLLQWYNGGIGQKPGLPDLLGCTVLPSMNACWKSRLSERKRKPEQKTWYEFEIRPKLIEWFQDPYKRGNPWPEDVRRAFTSGIGDMWQEYPSSFVPFGTPITDFLITGDESSIHEVLEELDTDDTVVSKNSSNGHLLDRGRPAQAVSTWVQCENRDCLKWRKIPWHVDIDLLPEKFYCRDNKWNPLANSCDSPEDDWDFNDSLVDADGKVEGSPIRKRKPDSAASPLDEKSFTKGARFDVLREDKEKYCVGVVSLVDFSGKVKRIKFHFPKMPPKYDEWIEFGSERIARLYTKVPKPASNKKAKISTETTKCEPLDQSCFNEGARFSVRRSDAIKYQEATVVEVDFSSEKKRMLFHFRNRLPKDDEWVELGSDRIRHWTGKPRKSLDSTGECEADKAKTLQPEDFVKEACFDVMHLASDKLEPAVVLDLDFSEDHKRVLFHFRSIFPRCEEWVDIESGRVAGKSKVPKNVGPMKARRPTEVTAHDIQEGDVFDVLRSGMHRFSMGVVQKVEISEAQKRVLFLFPKAQPKATEWVTLDTDFIKPYKPRPRYKPKAANGDDPPTETSRKENVTGNQKQKQSKDKDKDKEEKQSKVYGLELLLSAIGGGAVPNKEDPADSSATTKNVESRNESHEAEAQGKIKELVTDEGKDAASERQKVPDPRRAVEERVTDRPKEVEAPSHILKSPPSLAPVDRPPISAPSYDMNVYKSPIESVLQLGSSGPAVGGAVRTDIATGLDQQFANIQAAAQVSRTVAGLPPAGAFTHGLHNPQAASYRFPAPFTGHHPGANFNSATILSMLPPSNQNPMNFQLPMNLPNPAYPSVAYQFNPLNWPGQNGPR